MRKDTLIFRSIIPAVIAISLTLAGCKSAEEAEGGSSLSEAGTKEAVQQELAGLKSLNESLKKQVTKLEQDNRSTTARAAELETRLNELKEKMAEAPPPEPASDPSIVYSEGLERFRSRQYAEAASLFQAALDGGIAEEWRDNCTYWLGECLYGRKNYEEAIEYFQKVFTFKISEKKDESQIMIANSYLAIGDKASAKEAYERLLNKFPASPYLKKARLKFGDL